jgi:GNAT superfamily N-acetyltransferase
MVLAPSATIPDPGSGVATRVVVDEASYEEFTGVFAAAGGTEEVARRVFPRSFVADPDVRCITALLDGRPVGTSVAIRTGDVAGVYAVGTLREARRRGVGTAATWSAVAAGRALGSETIVLQSSAMGFRVYEAMGFQTVVRYAIYARR